MNIDEAKLILQDKQAFQAIAGFADKIVKKLNLNKDAKILDVGTGEGYMAIILALNGFHVVTGEPEDDYSEYSRKNWQSNAQRLAVNNSIEFKSFDAAKLPFEKDHFDAIFLLGCLHHMAEESRATAIRECVRTIKDTGTIVLLEPNQKSLERIQQMHPDHPALIDPSDYCKGLELSISVDHGELFSAYILDAI